MRNLKAETSASTHTVNSAPAYNRQMLQTRTASPCRSPISSIEVGELIRQVSDILAEERSLAQRISDLCALFTLAFGAKSVSILIEDGVHSHVEYRYDLPLEAVEHVGELRARTIPLQIGEQLIGILTMAQRRRDEFSDRDAATLDACIRYLAVSLRNASLTDANGDLTRLIEVDPLTEVGNRRCFDGAIATEWRRCGRNSRPLSVLMVDIDYFKEFNDQYGHVSGDICLQQVAKAISGSTMRAGDVVTRYGGDEFAVVLAETDSAGGAAVAENIRLAVQRLHIPHAASALGNVSVSVGVATVTPAQEGSAESLVEAADRALYLAKSSTRDRIFVAAYALHAVTQPVESLGAYDPG